MLSKSLKLFSVVLLACLAVSFRANAQSTTQGAIAGTVFDANSAVVANASVVIHNDGTNSELTLTTDGSGYFKQPLLQPGTYTVTVHAAGFKDYKATTVTVEVGKLTQLQPHLPVGSAAESVTVSTDAPIINYEAPDFASNLNERAIDSLPINGRRWSDLTLLTPGVTSDTSGFGLLSFRGISTLFNNVQIDGADDNQAFYAEERGRTREGYSTAQVAVKEFQVNTGVYQAEYGRAAGGVVNSVTKSGTNQLHGELYFYDRDNNWGAINPFATITRVSGTAVVTSPYKPKDWRKQWGFGLGGPIIKDKVFFFYAYDGFRRNFPGTGVANNQNGGTGATGSAQGFYSIPTQTAPGNGGTCNATGQVTGGTGTVTPIDNQACALAARTGQTYAAAAATWVTYLTALNTDLGPVKRTGDQTINTPKIDWQVNSKQHLSLLYHRLRWDSPGGVQTQKVNMYGTGSFGNDFVKLDYGLAKLDSVITPHITNEIRYQYGRELNDESAQPQTPYDIANYTNGSGALPQLQIAYNGGINSTTTNYGFYAGTPYYSFRLALPDERKWQIADTLNWVHGNHTFKAGVDIVHNNDIINNLYESNGLYAYAFLGNYFADVYNKNNARPNSCDSSGQLAYASSTAGAVTGAYPCYYRYQQGFGTPAFELATTDYGYFVQDTWKATPRLTLDLGLRYEYENIPSPYASTVNPVIPQTTNRPNDRNNFGPRAGFVLDLFGTGKSVLRGGYGLYYGLVPVYYVITTYINSANAVTAGQNAITYTPITAGAPKFPAVVATASSNFPAPPNVEYFTKNYQNPMVHEFDLAVQQDLSHGTVLSVSYLGALGRELPNTLNVNLNPAAAYTETITPKANANGQYGPLGASAFNTTVYAGTQTTVSGGAVVSTPVLKNPAYGAILQNVSNVNSSYHALVAEIQNKTYKMFQWDANYTWSHALDFNQNANTAPGSNNWADPYSNPRVNYGPSIYNIPNRFVGWVLISSTTHYTDWKKYIFNGWNLNPLFQAQTGLPYSMAVSSVPAQCTTTTTNLTPCYQASAAGFTGSGVTFVPGQRNAYHYRRDLVLDLRAEKEFTIAEKYRLQLIGEAFNLANHINVTGVSSTTGYSFATTGTGAANATFTTPYTSGNFGFPNNGNSNYTYSERQIQLAIRLAF
ncbi:MAG TPA: carboxypeptidase regulatory-like domain-containing protein [Acidobacteriaceae bacterium]